MNDTATFPLQRLRGGEPAHQMSLEDLASAGANLKCEIEADEEVAKLKKKLLAEIDSVLVQKFEAGVADQVTVTHPFGRHTVSAKKDFQCSVLAADKPRLIDWLKDHGACDLVKEDVNHQTLRSHVKDLVDEGRDLPPMVKPVYLDKIAYRSV